MNFGSMLPKRRLHSLSIDEYLIDELLILSEQLFLKKKKNPRPTVLGLKRGGGYLRCTFKMKRSFYMPSSALPLRREPIEFAPSGE